MNIFKLFKPTPKPEPPDPKFAVFRSWIIREHNLILKKQSDLSAIERQQCIAVYDDMVKEGKIIKEVNK